MRFKSLILLMFISIALLVAGCTAPLNINDLKIYCNKTRECLTGWKCINNICVNTSADKDVIQDRGPDTACVPDCAGKECGDNGCGGSCGTCDASAGENCSTCAADCGNCCGNGKCEADRGENCATCPADCKCANGQACFKNACCKPKTCQDLGWECGTGFDDDCGGRLFCGDCGLHKACEDGKCVDQPYCGNNTCDPNENCATCPADCGNCCGNGTCDAGAGENCATCAGDCACAEHQACQTHKCVAVPWCGDGQCSGGENCGTCPQDCGCDSGQVCFNAACCLPNTCAGLGRKCGKADDGCGGQVNCGGCGDGNPCTVDSCDETSGGCIHVAKDCDDGNPCTGDTCDSATGGCKHNPKPDRHDLGDGRVCYQGKPCTPKNCQSGVECGNQDDGCGSTLDCGGCGEHEACETGKCVTQPYCGNGTCDPNENCSCAGDCACGQGQVCYNNACCTPKTCADLGLECGTGNNGCGGTVDCGGCEGGKICNKGRCVSTIPGFVRIPSGCFNMGSPATEAGRYGDEGPVHHVCINRSFLMSGTEVTQGQWKALMGNNPSYFASCGDDCPVEQVSWWDAIAYSNALSNKEGVEKCYTLTGCSGTPGKDYACSKVVFKGLGCKGYRLPTEAEREYAARAGTTTATYNGDLDASHLGCEEPNSVLDSIAWFCGNSGGNTHVVGKKAPNAWGLYDMSGNVWEWCWDWYKKDYYKESPSTDPLGPDTGSSRVFRGGRWYFYARFCRSAFRGTYPPGARTYVLGFRLVRSL